jgi:hypothetical protein
VTLTSVEMLHLHDHARRMHAAIQQRDCPACQRFGGAGVEPHAEAIEVRVERLEQARVDASVMTSSSGEGKTWSS